MNHFTIHLVKHIYAGAIYVLAIVAILLAACDPGKVPETAWVVNYTYKDKNGGTAQVSIVLEDPNFKRMTVEKLQGLVGGLYMRHTNAAPDTIIILNLMKMDKK